MKINSHLKHVKKQIIDALSSEKKFLISKFEKVIYNNAKLFKSKELNFWITQLEKNDWELIPTTKLGVQEELQYWQNYEPSIKTIIDNLRKTSEKVLIYWSEDDLCEMQSQYFYYKDLESNKIFKESEFGNLVNINKNEIIETNIALIPDLINSKLFDKTIYNELYE